MADAPEIDGVVRIANGSTLKPGQFVDLRVPGAREHDLAAVPGDEKEPLSPERLHVRGRGGCRPSA
ncbi:MAG: hypothetical protein ACREPL_09175 [Rhodanobacteraceae bacterium]